MAVFGPLPTVPLTVPLMMAQNEPFVPAHQVSVRAAGSEIVLIASLIAGIASGGYGLGRGIGWCLNRLVSGKERNDGPPEERIPEKASVKMLPMGNPALPRPQHVPDPGRTVKRMGRLIDRLLFQGTTQVFPRAGRPVRIEDRKAELIHKVSDRNAPVVLREMLKRKYEGEYRVWNIVVFQDDNVTIRVADAWDPGARLHDLPREVGIKHDQIAEGKPCIFAGTLRIEGDPSRFKLILTNDSGAYGRDIRITPDKVKMIATTLARRFRIPMDRIEFRRVHPG